MSINSAAVGNPVIEGLILQPYRKLAQSVRNQIEWRRVYSNTFHQLSNLSDRDLTDLDFARVNLRQIAREAADEAVVRS